MNDNEIISDFITQNKGSYSREEVISLINAYVDAIYKNVMCIRSYGCHEDAIEKDVVLKRVKQYKLSYGLKDGREQK